MWQFFLLRLSPIVPKALLSPLVISLLCLQLNTSILWRISYLRFFLYLFIHFVGWGLLGDSQLLPHVFHVSFLFSVCIRSESIFLQLFLMMLSVCFYIRYIPNLYCYHDHIDVSYDFVFVVQIFNLRSSPVPEFVLIFVAIESRSWHWSFVEFQRTVKWCL